MNAYKISYWSPGMDEMMTATVTAPDNRVAERSFKAGFKGSGLPAPDIFHIELVSTNVTATKDQEREALEKIKAIVEALGPDSYIGTALEGCFEIAERNIENDFACSMKRRAEAAERKAEELEKKVSALELDNRDLRLAIKKEKEEASATETALRERVVSDDDLTDCRRTPGPHSCRRSGGLHRFGGQRECSADHRGRRCGVGELHAPDGQPDHGERDGHHQLCQ